LDVLKGRSNPLKSKNPRTYRIWQAMLNRCRNPNIAQWKRWGGRGITVCEEWEVFDNFIKDMGSAPKNNSIDRIDNNGNYCKENCRWATKEQQARNTSANRIIEFQGEKKILKDWADYLNIDQASLRERLKKWPLERALTEPKRGIV
jgi:hypothetical protein